MKKIISLLLCALLLVGCEGNTTANNTVEAPTDTTKDTSNSVSNGNSIVAGEAAVSSEKLEIVKEYQLKTNEYSSYTYHVLVVQNNNDVDCIVKTNSKAYDAEGNLLGIENDQSSVIGPGYQGIIIEAFDEIENATSFETTLTASESDYYKSVNSIIDMELNATSSKVFVTLTNNGDYAAESLCAYVIFLDGDGNCVDYDYQYMNMTDFELKPGETVSEEFKTSEAFASAEVYISGSSYTR